VPTENEILNPSNASMKLPNKEIKVPAPSEIIPNTGLVETEVGLPLAPEPLERKKITIPKTKKPPMKSTNSASLSSTSIIVASSKTYSEEPKKENRSELNLRSCKNELFFLLTKNPIKFFSGSARLIPSSRPTLAAIADVMLRCPSYIYTIEGHTDNTGDEDTNLTLSRERAETVKNYLISRTVNAEMLISSGFGSSMPIAENDTLIGQETNRRVDINIQETELN